MNFIALIFKGFLVGLAKIIPGVSGAVLAISLGVYEKAIESISTFFKNPMKSIIYLFPLGMGLLLAIVMGSNILLYILDHYYVITLFFFLGLMIGGMPELFSKISFSDLRWFHYVLLILSFSIPLLLLIGSKNTSSISYFWIGFIDAVTMIIPGISGTAVMMLLGCYDKLLNLMSSLGNISQISSNMMPLLSYGSSLIISVFFISKVMNYLFQKKEQIIYTIIIGFMMSSICILSFDTIFRITTIWQVIIGIILFIVGCKIALKVH